MPSENRMSLQGRLRKLGQLGEARLSTSLKVPGSAIKPHSWTPVFGRTCVGYATANDHFIPIAEVLYPINILPLPGLCLIKRLQ